jgi:hypothetical protein
VHVAASAVAEYVLRGRFRAGNMYDEPEVAVAAAVDAISLA